MSELEDKETVYREKLDRIKLCNIGLDVATGHLKGLPTVILTNLVVLIVVSVGAYDLSIDATYLRTVATWTLVAFSASFVFMAWLSLWLTPRLTKNERYSEDLLAEVKALRRLTVAGFRTYLGTMPRIAPVHITPGLLDQRGGLNRPALNLEWRKNTKTFPSIHENMLFLSRPLMDRMDLLSKLSVNFADLFDDYSEAFQKAFRKWNEKLDGEDFETTQKVRTAIVGSYLYFSKEIQNETDLKSPQRLAVDFQVEEFLREFLSGDNRDAHVVASLRTNANLTEMAIQAKVAQDIAVSESEVVHSMLNERLAKWESSLR